MSAEARLTIDLDALAANHAALRALAGGVEVAAVVKADAYGLGLAPVARRLWAEGARRFFVARVSEGEALRGVLGAGPLIHVLDGCPPGAGQRLIDASLSPVLDSREQIAAWAALGRATRAVRPALHVDTGLNRLGVHLGDLAGLAKPLNDLGVDLVISHLARADRPDDPLNRHQRDALARIGADFIDARVSLANSWGLFLGQDYLFDLVRPGIAVYGGGPFSGTRFRALPVATFEAPILQIRDVSAGESVGYGGAWTARSRTRVAVIAAGYADGVLCAQSPGGYGWLDGGRVVLLGRVSMDLIALDVTDHPGAQPGDPIELLGPNVRLDDPDSAPGVLAYERLARLSARATRIYRGEVA